MFRNYIKTALRSLFKNSFYTGLNVAGLATGIAAAALILLWVENEATFNHSFVKRDRLYQVMENRKINGTVTTGGGTPAPAAEALKAEIPGIANTMRKSWNMDELFVRDEKRIKGNGIYADPSVFSMLQLPFVYGNPSEAFKQTRAIVISESLAEKFFGKTDPVGKTIAADARQGFTIDGLLTVTGVFRDLPSNATFQFQWISPFELWEQDKSWLKGQWGNNIIETFAELKPATPVTAVDKMLGHYLAGKDAGNNNQLFLFSMNDWHLRDHFTDGKPDGGQITYVRLFSGIAIVILLIACINFMNLSTARSEQRAKEVGVRKVMGAGKRRLVQQFLLESLLLSLCAVFLAAGLTSLLLPAFNDIVGQQLETDFLQPGHLLALTGIWLLTGLTSGSYPAFYLSAFRPVYVLKGIKVKTDAGADFIRRGLVVFQFVISVVLIICTTLIYSQVNHVKTRNLGYNKNNLLNIPIQGELKKNFAVLKTDLLKTGVVDQAALNEFTALTVYGGSGGFRWEGMNPNENVYISDNHIGPGFISAMGMQVVAGRDFYPDEKSDSSSVIINQSLAARMGGAGKVGSVITVDQYRLTVVGIISDPVYNNFYGQSQPLILFCNSNPANDITLHIKTGTDLARGLTVIESAIKRLNPGYPFEFSFLDQEFDKLFKTENLTGKLAGVFAGLAILISCLGLFGLAAYTASRRVKEIGVRKVLGASVGNLVGLLSFDFVKLVAVSCVIAFPLAWLAMNHWLQSYEYRIAIHWWVFGLAALAAMLIALVTVSFQAIRAALANPVRSLRSE